MSWFDEKDDVHTILNHLSNRTPDSIRDDAVRELLRRGWSKDEVRDELYKHGSGSPVLFYK